MFEDAHDNMVFTDPETGDQLIFHRKTWLCTIHGILTRYLGFTPELAYDMIKNAPLCSDAGINYHSVGMLCHDEEYHWAMILAYGEGYWNLYWQNLLIMTIGYSCERRSQELSGKHSG